MPNTPLEIAEALVQSLPVTIQQSGGDPIKIVATRINFDPDTEAATDNPTSFWIRTGEGETFTCFIAERNEEFPAYVESGTVDSLVHLMNLAADRPNFSLDQIETILESMASLKAALEEPRPDQTA